MWCASLKTSSRKPEWLVSMVEADCSSECDGQCVHIRSQLTWEWRETSHLYHHESVQGQWIYTYIIYTYINILVLWVLIPCVNFLVIQLVTSSRFSYWSVIKNLLTFHLHPFYLEEGKIVFWHSSPSLTGYNLISIIDNIIREKLWV